MRKLHTFLAIIVVLCVTTFKYSAYSVLSFFSAHIVQVPFNTSELPQLQIVKQDAHWYLHFEFERRKFSQGMFILLAINSVKVRL